jgi:hypothetical protein
MDKGFKFQVRWDGRVVRGVTKVSALKRGTEVTEQRESCDPSTSRNCRALRSIRTSYWLAGRRMTVSRARGGKSITPCPPGNNWSSCQIQGAATFAEMKRNEFAAKLQGPRLPGARLPLVLTSQVGPIATLVQTERRC